MTRHWKEGAVFCLAGMNTRCFKNSNLWFGKVCFSFYSKTSCMEYLEAKQIILIFFFLSKKAFLMGTKN